MCFYWCSPSSQVRFIPWWRHPEAGTLWALRAADHTPGTVTSINSNMAPFAQTEALGGYRKAVANQKWVLWGLEENITNEHVYTKINLCIHHLLSKNPSPHSKCNVQVPGMRINESRMAQSPLSPLFLLLYFDSGLPRVRYRAFACSLCILQITASQ